MPSALEASTTMKALRLTTLFAGFAALAAAASAQTAAAQAPKLKVGDPAPAMQVAKWVKGTPVQEFEAGKKYVVEFWATWCGPCKVSIPHLTELAKKHTDVAFAGISIWEKTPDAPEQDYPAKITKFVDDMGAKMDYSVGYEDVDAAPMAKNWMAAAGQNGIPSSFLVIDKKIAWIGHPMRLGEILDKVKEGTFDPQAQLKLEAEEEAKAMELAKKNEARLKPVMEAAQAGDYEKAVAELDKVFTAEPESEKELGMFKYNLLAQYDEKAFFAYGTKLAGMLDDDAMSLNQIAWLMLGEDIPLKTSDDAAAIKIAERANELTKSENAMILDTLALAYFKAKKIDEAIKWQEKAVAQLDKTEGVTDDIREEIKGRLEKFKKAKKDGGS